MFKKLTLLSIIILSFSCSSSRISTTNLHDLASFETGSVIYALPQTLLIFTVTATKSTFSPGPYCDYARKFLGLQNVKRLPATNWQILDFEMGRITEPDPDHFYSVRAEGNMDFSSELESLRMEGLLYMPASNNAYQIDYNEKIKPVQELKHTDLSVKPFYSSKRNSRAKTGRDSLNTSLPIYSDDLKAKTDEEKAKEAAAFIIKIRKRRFKLLAGQYEVFPEGIALEASVRELDKLENEYLSLFIGTITTDTITRVYSFLPEAKESIQRKTLFRFSETEGFQSSTNPDGEAVIVEITDLEQTRTLSQLQLPVSATSYNDLIFYRIPDKANVKTRHGSHLIHEGEIPVCQFGTLVPMFVYVKKNFILKK